MDDEEDATGGPSRSTVDAGNAAEVSADRRVSRSKPGRTMQRKGPRLGHRFTNVGATSSSEHVKYLDPAEVRKLAARYRLEEAPLTGALDEVRRSWACDEQRRLDQANSHLVDAAIVKAKEFRAAWERLSHGHRASVFAHRPDGATDSGRFDRTLAYLAEEVELFLRLGPKVPISKRMGPRDTVVRLLAAFWKDQKGEPVSAQGQSASSARFVRDAVKMITGKDLPEHALREALEGKSEPRTAG